jgi:hypothetical protein
MSSDIVSSRSLRKSVFVAARGASCDDAKLRAGVMSEVAEDVHARISPMSCRRSNAKCNAGSVSRIWVWVSSVQHANCVFEEEFCLQFILRTEGLIIIKEIMRGA